MEPPEYALSPAVEKQLEAYGEQEMSTQFLDQSGGARCFFLLLFVLWASAIIYSAISGRQQKGWKY